MLLSARKVNYNLTTMPRKSLYIVMQDETPDIFVFSSREEAIRWVSQNKKDYYPMSAFERYMNKKDPFDTYFERDREGISETMAMDCKPRKTETTWRNRKGEEIKIHTATDLTHSQTL